jgi:glycosyltransferase involved in cell wall biosynthesis
VSERSEQRDASGRPVVLFAGQDWWFHGRAHADFQVVKELARTRPALIVNSIGMRFPTPGKTDAIVRRIVRKLKSTTRFLQRPLPWLPGLSVLTPVSVPLYRWRLTRRAMAWVVARQVRLACRRVGIRDPWVIAVVPTSIDVIERLGWRDVVYYRADDHAAAIDVDHDLVRRMEDRLIARSAYVFYASPTLLLREADRVGDKGMFLDHGVELEHFRPEPDALAAPDVSAIPHPRIGFFGQIERESVDVALLERLAIELPEAQLVLIGRAAADLSGLPVLPNVHLLGWRDYEELPAAARGFDVAICPMPRSEWITSANPIKAKEYLALGLPVVGTRIPTLERYDDVMVLAFDADEFVDGVRKALDGSAPGTPAERRAAVMDSGWEARAAQLAEVSLAAFEGAHR